MAVERNRRSAISALVRCWPTRKTAGLLASGGPYGLAVDPAGDLWVEGSPSAAADAVCEYVKAQLVKPGPPAPRATISPGYQLWDFTFDSSGNLWVPKYYLNELAEYTKADLTKSGSPTPARSIQHAATGLNNPNYLAIEP